MRPIRKVALDVAFIQFAAIRRQDLRRIEGNLHHAKLLQDFRIVLVLLTESSDGWKEGVRGRPLREKAVSNQLFELLSDLEVFFQRRVERSGVLARHPFTLRAVLLFLRLVCQCGRCHHRLR
jgi:hypothetical protein